MLNSRWVYIWLCILRRFDLICGFVGTLLTTSHDGRSVLGHPRLAAAETRVGVVVRSVTGQLRRGAALAPEGTAEVLAARAALLGDAVLAAYVFPGLGQEEDREGGDDEPEPGVQHGTQVAGRLRTFPITILVAVEHKQG